MTERHDWTERRSPKGDAGTSAGSKRRTRRQAAGLQFTRHADQRLRQRGLRTKDIELVMALGTQGPAGRVVLLASDAAREIAECKRRIQTLERLRGCVVVCEQGMVITCYHASGPAARHVMRDDRRRRPQPPGKATPGSGTRMRSHGQWERRSRTTPKTRSSTPPLPARITEAPRKSS